MSPRLSSDELRKTHAYWRACNYLAAGMIYLRDNPLLRTPLKAEHIKQRLLGHWGTSPGLSFVYVDVIDRVPRLQVAGAHVKEKLRNMQIDCQHYAYEHGVDKPEIDQWTWP